MKFGPWYPLGEASAHAPAARGVLQVRVEAGLLDYPTGKSAMVHYELADDVRAAAVAFAAARGAAGLLARHTIELGDADADALPALHARLVRDFRRRFGVAPGERA